MRIDQHAQNELEITAYEPKIERTDDYSPYILHKCLIMLFSQNRSYKKIHQSIFHEHSHFILSHSHETSYIT